jgi:hypothetical protein
MKYEMLSFNQFLCFCCLFDFPGSDSGSYVPKIAEARLYQSGFLGKHEAKSASIKMSVSKQALLDNGTMIQMHHFHAILQSVQYS